MRTFLNNIGIAFTTENIELVNWLVLPLYPVEAYLFMSLFLQIININANKRQKIFYVIGMSLIAILSTIFIETPFNIPINYLCLFFYIKYIFNINISRSIIALVIPTFVLALLNILLQNPYLMFFNISPNAFLAVPIYRLFYLIILYFSLYIICIFLKRFKNLRFSLDLFDNLDKKTLLILYITIFVGFSTLFIQLILTAYYIDIIPIIISLLNFILLITFLWFCIYSFTRIVKLATTQKNLQSAEEYNKSLEILYDKVKGFQHDFGNIVSTIDGFILNKDINGLKNYFDGVKRDCKITNNLSVLNPRRINNPGIYSLLNNKYFKATESGVTLNIDYFINLNDVKINLYELSRILGVLIDNAIEEAEKCKEKIVNIIMRKEEKNHRAIIIIENTYSNKDVDIEKIYEKGHSSKNNHSGFGLWEVRKFVSKSKNLDLFTTKNYQFFKQELAIYDF